MLYFLAILTECIHFIDVSDIFYYYYYRVIIGFFLIET